MNVLTLLGVFAITHPEDFLAHVGAAVLLAGLLGQPWLWWKRLTRPRPATVPLWMIDHEHRAIEARIRAGARR